jgi:hypothetical protein
MRVEIVNEKHIDEHIGQFIGLLESGEYRQLVMENDERGNEWAIGGESFEDYAARIKQPENYAYITNRHISK